MDENVGSFGGETWFVNRNGDQFSAPDLGTLQQWCREARVLRSDLIFHETLGRWTRADQVGHLRAELNLAVVAASVPWYRRTWVHVVALALVPYIQMPVMWILGVFSRNARIAITVVGIIWTVMIVKDVPLHEKRPQTSATTARSTLTKFERANMELQFQQAFVIAVQQEMTAAAQDKAGAGNTELAAKLMDAARYDSPHMEAFRRTATTMAHDMPDDLLQQAVTDDATMTHLAHDMLRRLGNAANAQRNR